MAESLNSTQLPPNVAAFCAMFPRSARLCRIVNRASGTLLDVRPGLDVVNDDVPEVVCNPEVAGVQYWLIVPYGNGQAIIPVPKDGSQKVRYLTPTTAQQEDTVTISPFPSSWIITPHGKFPKNKNPRVAYSVPENAYEQWTCLITWPHLHEHRGGARTLDLWASNPAPNQRVVAYFAEVVKDWQFWLLQFIRYTHDDYIPPILPYYEPPFGNGEPIPELFPEPKDS